MKLNTNNNNKNVDRHIENGLDVTPIGKLCPIRGIFNLPSTTSEIGSNNAFISSLEENCNISNAGSAGSVLALYDSIKYVY